MTIDRDHRAEARQVEVLADVLFDVASCARKGRLDPARRWRRVPSSPLPAERPPPRPAPRPHAREVRTHETGVGSSDRAAGVSNITRSTAPQRDRIRIGAPPASKTTTSPGKSMRGSPVEHSTPSESSSSTTRPGATNAQSRAVEWTWRRSRPCGLDSRPGRASKWRQPIVRASIGCHALPEQPPCHRSVTSILRPKSPATGG